MANPEHVEILKQGVEVWNAWRKESPDVRPNLRGSHLPKIDLEKVNLEKANLNETYLVKVNLNNASLDDADLNGAVILESFLKNSSLVGAYLRKTIFFGVNLNKANLEKARFYDAILCGVDLEYANLIETYFIGAYLNGVNFVGTILDEADFRGSTFEDVNFQKTDLRRVDLRGSDLNGADLSDANLREITVGKTSFRNADLSGTKGLEEIDHRGPSAIGINTIHNSKGKIPEVFLRGCGLSDYEIEIVKLWRKGMDRNEVTNIAYDLVNLYCGDGLQFYSCFISYNNADETFARKLHDDLQDNGVRCWFAPKDMKIGDRIRPRIDQEIRLRDKLLVILSENSVDSEWVGDEVEAALEEERMDGRTILFPIRLDDAVMDVRRDWVAKIRRRRHIGDFSGWQDEVQYQQGFQRLLRDLKAMGSE